MKTKSKAITSKNIAKSADGSDSSVYSDLNEDSSSNSENEEKEPMTKIKVNPKLGNKSKNVSNSSSSSYSDSEGESMSTSKPKRKCKKIKSNGKEAKQKNINEKSGSDLSSFFEDSDEDFISKKVVKSDFKSNKKSENVKMNGTTSKQKMVEEDDSDLSSFAEKSDFDEHSDSDEESNLNKDAIFDSKGLESSVPKVSAVGNTSSAIVRNAVDEYAQGDTSDEEDIRNSVGNIPMKWYDDFPHIGYDIQGRKIMKPATTDEIDEFLSKIDDPNYWRTVKNKMTGEKVVLTDEDLDIIQRIQSGKFPTSDVKYEPWEDFFTYKEEEFPVTHFPPHKRSFIPSKIEKAKVSKLVHAIKMGWIKPRVPKEEKEKFYNLWESDVADDIKRIRHIPAPKRKLPGHEESYNPPPEYIFDKEEEEKWKEQEPDERKLDFIPKKYSCLRQVPAYSQFIKEAFERCLDLYLCPRQRKMRVNVDPNDLLPSLPKPKDLQPFPTTLAIVYKGHSELVRCITVEPSGQFLASGSDDHTVRIWEVLTGRCLRTITVEGTIKSLAWCPTETLSLILVAVDEKIYVINTKVGDKVVISNTDLVLSTLPEEPEDKIVSWVQPSEEQKEQGYRLVITHSHPIKQVVWHAKGDYFATLTSENSYRAIAIHQLSKFRSQIPFKKLGGNTQCIMFHPLRPFFFVASQKHVKMFNLIKQERAKKLIGNCKLISNIAIHPQGDNIIVGSYDCKVNWFDLELSKKPYKTFRHHQKAVRQVAFHKRYPLFASTSDDGNVIISHGMVYSDLLQNPTIQFVKALKGHEMSLDCGFHPQRPWIFSASGDTVRLYS